MARKKIVFVIVEGPSDDDAIGYFLDKLFDKNTVYVQVMHCDITTQNGVNSKNIHLKCCDVIKNYAANNSFRKTDFQEFIHIVYTDGAYISPERITEDPSATEVIYTPNNIICKKKSDIEKRNEQKSSVLDKLIGCKNIWATIPYRVFYMSCNLDHVLYDKQNSTDEEKEANAHAFAKKYKNKLADFRSFITESSFSVCTDYQESWDFIKQGENSLNRYTNLGLSFPTKDE